MFQKEFSKSVSPVFDPKLQLKPGEIFREVVVPDDLPSKVDMAGYIDPNVRIKQMELAGIRIDAWNKAVYDYEHEDMDDGFSVAKERYDDDDLEMLTVGMREVELYEREMYNYYKKQLEARNAQPVEASPQPEAVKSESVTPVTDV